MEREISEIKQKLIQLQLSKVNKNVFESTLPSGWNDKHVGSFSLIDSSINNNSYILYNDADKIYIESDGTSSKDFYLGYTTIEGNQVSIQYQGNYKVTIQIKCFDTYFYPNDPFILNMYQRDENGNEVIYMTLILDQFNPASQCDPDGSLFIKSGDFKTYNISKIFYLSSNCTYYFKLEELNNLNRNDDYPITSIIAGCLGLLEVSNNYSIENKRQLLIDRNITKMLFEFSSDGHPI